MSVIQIACNPVNAKLMTSNRAIKSAVSQMLSYKVSGAEHSEAYRRGQWDGRSTFFTYASGIFPSGFVNLVSAGLRKLGHEVQVARKTLPAPLGDADFENFDGFGGNPVYQFQPDTVHKLLRNGQMIAQVATGGGKSRICRLAFARIRRPTMFLTTRSVLMYQMKDVFEETFGFKAGVMGDSEWTPRKGFNVAMVQTLAARLRDMVFQDEFDKALKRDIDAQAKAAKKGKAYTRTPIAKLEEQIKEKIRLHNERRVKTQRILEHFEFVILEEAHESSGTSFYDVMRQCKNAAYRLSLTATPFMKDDEEANMRLMACSGPVGIRVTEKYLIDNGILATPYFKFVNLGKPPKLYRSTPWQSAYRIGITENKERNESIVAEVERVARYGLSSMVLVQHKAHGKVLSDMMRERGIRAEFIFGDHKQHERSAALKRLGAGEIDVLIGSTILDVGVDVPSIGLVVLAGGGKAEVALRQRVGRGLRSKKTGPNVAFVVDFTDEWNSHLMEHASTRRYYIETTPGFSENVIAPDQDFDLESLGFVRIAA